MQRNDGYMELHVAPGAAEVELRYVVTALDWAGRLASLVGVVGLAWLAVAGGRLEERLGGKLPIPGAAGPPEA